MPWTNNDYPSSMKNLDKKVRSKAIEVANELVEEGYEEDGAIPIAIDRAKEWSNDNKSSNSTSSNDTNNNSNSSSSKKEDQHLLPDGDNWIIKKENSEQASYTFDTKKEALNKAKNIASNQLVNLVIHREDGTIEDIITP
ncbi:DUF2188 domain-containing protein [Clostridium sp. D2Q-11]|uniref:DUF2188 domain-containing protein n=1 Tax=Anaeromonas frigoriresistens TaxID=2683708 RepID=A0A942URH6_9FIRM|nr:DUF2188 domain-containing protein [Anaeromonas frigoriresistens]MBS4537238.1 DUF2188 domain-containing protein [Anaeromonas frigoriresistens]